MNPLHTRIAPTASGYLHEGNAASFVLTWAYARASGGTVRLRVDELDAARIRTEYFDDIFETLHWLGLDWDAGAQSTDDLLKNYRQQQRMERYFSVVAALKKEFPEGIYFCNCSRKKIKSHFYDGIYRGLCRPNDKKNVPTLLDTGGYALRIKIGEKDIETSPELSEMGDFVIQQKDGTPAYQIASLTDDLDFGINFIVRGTDLRGSTAAQCFLAKILNFQPFLNAQFLHHELVKDVYSGEKLSKSAGAISMKEWRTSGLSNVSIFQRAAIWAGCEFPKDIICGADLIHFLKNKHQND